MGRILSDRVRRTLVVIAHPDDESFGLGGVILALAARGMSLSILCFTHGEQSTLGADCADLATLRRAELMAASRALGIARVSLLAYADGGLEKVVMDELTAHILAHAEDVDAFLVFDEGGVTGHRDHCRATDAALAAAEEFDLSVLAWAIPDSVAEKLNEEFGTSFVGRREEELDLTFEVDRACQLEAIACHESQSAQNAVLWRRLELLGNRESLRLLRVPGARARAPGTALSDGK
jgi:LmbE family N-acetylglucosaminyl deacetylase